MEIAQILINIFGEYPTIGFTPDFRGFTLERHIAELKQWLIHTQSPIHHDEDIETAEQANGKIGPRTVVLDVEDGNPFLNMSKDKLTVQSQSGFLTMKGNCCVYKGKWMYEVQLRSKGVMQIGWCSAKCKFTQDTGVGDTRNSYGLDGSKQRLWNVHTRKYGPFWRSGDIYGVCLDMDTGTLEYYRNGIALGEAFNNIDRGPGIALYPAFSLAFNDSITVNFGGSPFRHPVVGYVPLQTRPSEMLRRAEFLLQHLVNISRVISTSKSANKDDSNALDGNSFLPSSSAVHMLVAGIFIEEICPLITNSYVIEENAFLFIKGMCVLRSDTETNAVIYPGMPESTLGTFLTLLWCHLPIKQMKLFISKLVNFLSSMYRETPIDLEYEKQRTVIVILTCLSNHPTTRRFMLENKFFKRNCLPVFLYIKPPDETTLGELLPDNKIWTDGLGGPKDEYLLACNRLIQCTDVLYSLQKRLVENLLRNDDGDSATPSSRKIFASMFRTYVMENSLEHRTFFFLQGNFSTPTQPAVALSFLCILLDVCQTLFLTETPREKHYVSPVNFYNGSLRYTHMDRVGGVISYLKKVYRRELEERLGVDHAFLQDGPPTQDGLSSDLNSAMFLITGTGLIPTHPLPMPDQSTQTEPESRTITVNLDRAGAFGIAGINTHSPAPILPENANPLLSLNELIDCCIMYYYAVAHKYIMMIADLRDNIGLLSEILIETKSAYADVKSAFEVLQIESQAMSSAQNEVLKELNERFGDRKNVFAQRSMELARKQAWYRALALGKRRRKLLAWMLGTIFQTLSDASQQGGLFGFVPEVYINIVPILLDTVLDFGFHDLREQYDHSDSMAIIQSAAEFLSAHLADSRIILVACNDSVLQALGTLTCHQAGVEALENASRESQLLLVHALMKPYQERAWGQNNWLLIRLWLGSGFAFRDSRPPCIWQNGDQHQPQGLKRSRGKGGSHTGLLHIIAPAYPSPYYYELIGQILTDNEPLSTAFVNSMLSQLNWAFSEFVLMLQEIQNNAQRQDQNVTFISRQLKICAMCFELTVSLIRSLEMVLSIAPAVFKDINRPNSDLLLGRVCQLISQVLARVTVPPGSFQFVIDLCLPDLSCVSHFTIITAAIGVVLALLMDEVDDEDDGNVTHVPRISKCLLTDPSFHIASLEFALDEIKTPIQVSETTPRGNFDPKTRSHIDPLTNEVRVATPRDPRADPPIIQFNLRNYTSHVNEREIDMVRLLIAALLKRQSILSDVTLPSEDSLCPICYSKAVSAIFEPCQHQSCNTCILQHLMNSNVCFYCKTFITVVHNFDGAVIYENPAIPSTPPSTPEQTSV